MARNIDILFRADGNQKIGLGHIKRCEVLASQFASSGRKVAFLTTPDEYAASYLEKKGFRVLHLKEWSTREEMFSRTVDAVLDIKPKLVFMDVINTELEPIQAMKAAGVLVASIDDLGPGSAVVDMLFGVDIGILDDMVPDATRNRPPQTTFGGLSHAIIAPRFTSLIESVSPEKFENRKIFVGFGGSDPCGSTAISLLTLAGWDFDFEAHVVIGPCMKNGEETVRIAIDAGIRFKPHIDPPDLGEIMAESALAICGVGQSLLELNMLGVPALLITQSPFHAAFAEKYIATGAAVHIGRHDSFSPDNLIAWCGKVLNDRDLWMQMHSAACRAVDGRGAPRIFYALSSLMSHRI